MTVADWKAALLKLDDGPFFDLMRSYLGDIRTPFNKQRLVDELEAFLSRREIQESVASYLDETDKLVVAAMGTLGDPVADELASFFEGELSYAELHAVLLNLEERLIVYRFAEGGIRRLALNPALSPVLDPVASDPVALFPSFPLDENARHEAGAVPEGLDDLFLAAVVAYIRRRSQLFRSDGSYRKKTLEDVSLAFSANRFTVAVDALRELGILTESDGSLRVEEERLSAFAALSPRDRSFYLAAGSCGAALEAQSPNKRSRLPKERVVSWARLFRSFVEALSPDRSYPRTTLFRLFDTAERSATAQRRRRWDPRAADHATELRGGVEASVFRAAALDALRGIGLLSETAGERYVSAGVVPESIEASRPSVSVDAAFSVVAYPEISFADALSLARFLDVAEAGRIVRFELTRESAVRGFDGGLSPGGMAEALERLSGRVAAQNVRWSLDEWHRRYSSVSVYRGVVLTVAEDRRFLVETPSVASLVSRTLAPGVYLLSVDSEDEAVAALEKAGTDIVALPQPILPDASPDGTRFAAFPALSHGHAHPVGAAPRRDAMPATFSGLNGTAAARIASLRVELERRNLPKVQRDELTARLERRVVLTSSQLVGAAVRYEKLEAKGLDYVGKVRVAEQALSNRSLVEIFWRGPRGEPLRALGNPVSLEKAGTEAELSVAPAPRGELVRIAVGKISLIRRIKRSIFGE